MRTKLHDTLTPLRSALELVTHVSAQTIFSRNRVIGLLILAAIGSMPSSLAFGMCALLGSELSVRALRLIRGYAPYNYNALLCGSALGSLYALTPTTIAFAVALGAFSVVVTAASASFMGSFGYIPITAIPYTLTIWCALGIAPYMQLAPALSSVDPWAAHLPHAAALWLQSLGSVVVVPRALAGALLLLALLLHSRIASLVAIGALSVVLGLLRLTHAQLPDALIQTVGANSTLAALALGGVWLVPSRASTIVAIGGAVLAAFFALGSAGPLYVLGLWPGFLPAGATLILVLTALRQRSEAQAPHLAQSIADNPEQLVLDHLARPRQHATGVLIAPPFQGAWCCTQGANGPFTHRGMLAHAYDFEIYDEADGTLCRTSGETPQDYHCFAQPVLAVADGTVVAIENAVPNNAIGDIDSQRPWGNYVILQHNPNVYSLVAHLSPGTVTVYPGQFVPRATVLGYCGSSGRSPRPHLHFQLQTAPGLGAATIPCELHDVLIRTGGRLRFEPLHEVAHGETLRALQPDYALAGLFDVPLGAELTYRVGDKLERIVCELDNWGRTQLRSLDYDAHLVFTRSPTCLRCGELYGNARSVLRLWRLALGLVPFERSPELRFGSSIPRRWVALPGRELAWDVGAALLSPSTMKVESRMELDAEGLAIVSASTERRANSEPVLRTCARFRQGAASLLPGPSMLEVTTLIGAPRTVRAELIVQAPEPHGLVAEDMRRAPPGFALELGDWS